MCSPVHPTSKTSPTNSTGKVDTSFRIIFSGSVKYDDGMIRASAGPSRGNLGGGQFFADAQILHITPQNIWR